MKKVGVLGSGLVGKVLAAGFVKHGYDVQLGTSNPDKLAEWQEQNPKVKITSFAETAAFGEILVLATKGHVSLHLLQQIGEDSLNGKLVLDATNPIDEQRAPEDGILPFFTTLNHSLLETYQEAFPKVNFVKSFSCVGNHFMVNPDFGGTKPTMFICGNSAEAKNEAIHILDQFGWEAEDIGKAAGARAIEPLCILWCAPGFLRNQWNHAYHVMRK